MDARATFVVEVIGALRDDVDVVTGRVAAALVLDEAKARLLVERMPGVITKPMPETRAAKVALRLQSVGLAAVHRPAHPVSFSPSDPNHGHQLHGPPLHGRETDEARSVPPQDPTATLSHGALSHGATPPHAAPSPPYDPPPYVPFGGRESERSALEGVPSVDATLIEERDVRDDPKLTPMTEAGFGAADIVVPTVPHREWPAPRSRRFTSPIVEGGATASPGRDPGEVARPAADDDPPPEDAAATMIRPVDAEPDGPAQTPAREDRAVTARDVPSRPRHTPAPVSASRPGDAPAPETSAPTRATPPHETPAPSSSPRAAPARDRAVGMVAPASRARDAIARDRAVGGGAHDERGRPPTLDDELHHTPPPERTYRSTRSAAESMLTLTPPPDAALKRSGVREEALPSTYARRRGTFGRYLSALIVVPMVSAWMLGAWFVWLLLPAGLRAELWVPLAAATGVAALFGALFAGLATSRIAHDVSRLRDASDRIAMGDLVQPVDLRRRDELGDIAAAVERMRVSLQEGLSRLRRRGR